MPVTELATCSDPSFFLAALQVIGATALFMVLIRIFTGPLKTEKSFHTTDSSSLLTKSLMQTRIKELETALGAVLESHEDCIEAFGKSMKQHDLEMAKDMQIIARNIYQERGRSSL
jgi:hypothetical protein